MVSLLHRIGAVIEKSARLLAQLAVFSTLMLTAVVTYGVVMRFVFNDPQNWTDELATYGLLWMVFLGLAYTLSTGAHIRIDFFINALPPRRRYYAEISAGAIGVLFSVLLFLGCVSAVENFIRRNTHSTAGLDIPLYWPSLPMLLGVLLFGLMMVTRLLQFCVMGRNSALPPEKRDEP
jgi:C4-dicarboxylate transporter DctQ subunit